MYSKCRLQLKTFSTGCWQGLHCSNPKLLCETASGGPSSGCVFNISLTAQGWVFLVLNQNICCWHSKLYPPCFALTGKKECNQEHIHFGLPFLFLVPSVIPRLLLEWVRVGQVFIVLFRSAQFQPLQEKDPMNTVEFLENLEWQQCWKFSIR